MYSWGRERKRAVRADGGSRDSAVKVCGCEVAGSLKEYGACRGCSGRRRDASENEEPCMMVLVMERESRKGCMFLGAR